MKKLIQDIKDVIIEATGEKEERLAEEYFTTMDPGFSVRKMGYRKLSGKFAQLYKGNHPFIAVGHLKFVTKALAIQGIEIPKPDSYPDCLEPHYHRQIIKNATPIQARKELYNQAVIRAENMLESKWRGLPLDLNQVLWRHASQFFFKDESTHKSFSGLVSVDDINRVTISSRNMDGPLAIASLTGSASEIVTFKTPSRVYVVNHNIGHISSSKKDGGPDIDVRVVQDCIELLEEDGGYPDSYSFDVGVIGSHTALIEMNDGFSIGAYDEVPTDVYGHMLYRRGIDLLAA